MLSDLINWFSSYGADFRERPVLVYVHIPEFVSNLNFDSRRQTQTPLESQQCPIPGLKMWVLQKNEIPDKNV